MAGKEAIVFLVDCHQSMAGHMELARKALQVLMVQKMLQGKQNELGIVLFGLPAEETANKLNDDNGDYVGVKEFCMVEKGSVDLLRKLREIDVPDSGNAEGKGDVLDAMVVGLHMIRQRTLKKAFSRHIYLLTDGATPVEEVDQLENIVNMYVDPSMQCKLHFVGFGAEAEGGLKLVKEEGGGDAAGANFVKDQNDKMLASVSAATTGSVVPASTVVNVMGESTIKTANPVLTKVDLTVGTKLAIHCRYFKKTDTGTSESLKKESVASYHASAQGAGDGKVRVDRTYRDPEMPEVEVDYENQVKGYRYGQDYIPVGPIDEGMLKLPEENASLKCLGFVPAASVSRHYFMDDTFVVVAEPTSAQSNGSVTSLVQAMRNLGQVAVVRFVRRKNSEPWLGVLIPDATGVMVGQPRWIFQKYPFSEDLRDYSFPSFDKAQASRRPSEEQNRVSASLVEALMIPEVKGTGGGVRAGLVLNPVRQGINSAKVARAMDPECAMPELPPSVKAAVSPEPFLLERAAPVLQEYLGAFKFEKQDRVKAGKKRVTHFSDLTLAEPETTTRSSSNTEGGSDSKKTKTEADSTFSGSKAKSAATHKVGSINPVSDFEAMMASARSGDEGSAELAERAVEQMQGVIHTLVKKGTTTAVRAKAVNCLKALRGACVSHFMGKNYNDFLQDMKEKYQEGDNSDIWEMAAQDEGTWPITSVDDGSLSMTPQGAAEFMKVVAVKEEEEDGEDDAGDDDDLDDMA